MKIDQELKQKVDDFYIEFKNHYNDFIGCYRDVYSFLEMLAGRFHQINVKLQKGEKTTTGLLDEQVLLEKIIDDLYDFGRTISYYIEDNFDNIERKLLNFIKALEKEDKQ